MKWKIVTDSGACIRYPNKVGENVGFQLVPLLINIGTELFIDNDIDNVPNLMQTMEASKMGSSSACPSPDTYATAFMDADNVICFTLSSGLSGSYNSAQLAKDIVLETYPDKKIHIFDSLAAGPSVDLLITRAIELANEDKDFDTLVAEMNEYFKSTKLVFMLESVDNLVKNGRLSKIVGGMIGLLGIRLVGTTTAEGQIDVIHKSKGTKRTLKTMLDELLKCGYKGGKIDLAHCLKEEVAKEFEALVLAQFPNARIDIRPTSGLCCYYAQRGGLMIGFEM